MKRSKSGSALLLTLLVVSLLLMITLAFTVYVRISLREVVTAQQERQAKAMARLSLNLSLGRLQDLAGADTRITARADLFDGSGSNVYAPDLAPNPISQYWSGVWDSSGFQMQDMQAKPFLGWLVSGDADDLDRIESSPASGNDLVPLLAGGSIRNAADSVYAPRETLASGDSFAWWAGDEGIKARVNLQDPWRSSANDQDRSNSWTAAQRHALERFFSDSSLYPLDSPAFDTLVQRWATLEQLPLSMASISDSARDAYEELIRSRYHEVSLHSASVLADVQRGGLKRDLTQAFEMSRERFLASVYAGGSPYAETPYYQPADYPSDEQVAPLFKVEDFSSFGFQPENGPMWSSESNERTSTTSTDPVFRGPTWHLFRNYYRLYKASDNDRSAYGQNSNMGVQNLSSGRPEITGRSFFPDIAALGDSRRYGQDPFTWSFVEDFKSGNQSDTYTVSRPISQPVMPGISPIMTRLQLVVSLRMRDAGDGVHMIPDLYLDPIITLWNPYNIALSTGENNGQPLQISVKNFDLRLELDDDGDNGVEHQQDFSTLLSLGTTGDAGYLRNGDEAFQLNLELPSGMSMEPGEFVIFSPRQGAVVYTRNESSPEDSGVVMDLAPGVSYLPEDSGFYFEDAFTVQLSRLMPDGVTERRIRFRSRSVADNSKIRLIGINRSTDAGPFFSSLQGAMSSIVNTSWSSASYRVDSSTLTLEKRPFVIYEIHNKVADSSDPIPLIRQFNPRAQVQEQGTYIRMEQTAYADREDLWFSYAERLSDWNGSWLDTHGSHGAFGGSSLQSNRGRSHVSLFEVPTRPLLSLGSLQHVPTGFFIDEPAFPIGNSSPSIFHRREEVLTQQQLNPDNNLARWSASGKTRTPTRNDWTVTRPDWSYWMNAQLWDRYYFSGMTGEAQAFYEGQERAAVSPLQPWLDRHQNAFSAAARLEDSDGRTQRADQVFSAQSLLEGGFNVNSTSTDAWKALLSAGRDLSLNSYGGGSSAADGSTFSRFSLPSQNSLNQDWEGLRSLSDAQIDLLAEAIVEQVRIRGPFLNLSDFVNRRLVPLGDAHEALGAAGPLQAAIDAAAVNAGMGGNSLAQEGFQANEIDNSRNPWIRENMSELSDLPVAEGNLGSLTQADVLTLISPLITARSDTFRIRAYGETGDGAARAWCEAIVQRVPAWQDSSRPRHEAAQWNPEDLPTADGSYDTSSPRRKFRIISFRWLNEEDV